MATVSPTCLAHRCTIVVAHTCATMRARARRSARKCTRRHAVRSPPHTPPPPPSPWPWMEQRMGSRTSDSVLATTHSRNVNVDPRRDCKSGFLPLREGIIIATRRIALNCPVESDHLANDLKHQPGRLIICLQTYQIQTLCYNVDRLRGSSCAFFDLCLADSLVK